MRFKRSGRILAGGAVLAVTAVAGWAAAVPGASADESTVTAELNTYRTEQPVGVQTAIGDSAVWYVGWVDRGLLKVRDETGDVLGAETPGSGWVAVNQGRHGRPLGRYQLETAYTPPSPLHEYRMQWIGAGTLLNKPSAETTVGAEHGDWGVAARRLQLRAGDQVDLAVQGNGVGGVSVLFGQPGMPETAVRNLASADEHFVVDKLTPPEDFSTFFFEAPATGDYLVVFDKGMDTKEKTTVITEVTPSRRPTGR
jgi:hypothetical protein